jgi:hypothetical protein
VPQNRTFKKSATKSHFKFKAKKHFKFKAKKALLKKV